MGSSNRRFERANGNGNGNGNGHVEGGVAVRSVAPRIQIVSALEELDEPTRALLDLSLRWELDDEQIAEVVQTGVDVLIETRAEAIRLLTEGTGIAPEDELDYVRDALEVVYNAPSPAPAPVDDPVLEELESLLELEPVEPVEPLEPAQPVEHVAPVEPEPRGRRVDLWLMAILALAAFLRVWQFNKLGINSDEAVYAGQGAAIAGDPALEPYFPAFRAHPLLFQTFLSIGDHLGILEQFGRLLSAAIGVATVGVTYLLGKLLYGRRAGLVAALLLALMPYHVVVTRQILLDGPMVFFCTLSLYLLARYAVTQHPGWLYAAGACMGLTAMTKETSLVLLGAIYAFLALTPQLKVTPKRLAGSIGALAFVFLLFPLSLKLAGKTETGGNYLAWQLFRRPNHDFGFYLSEVPKAMGFLLVLAVIIGLWRLRKNASWRETLLLAWIAVPVVFFQLWPVKGFQYLLPVAPAVAVLGGYVLARWLFAERKGPRTLLTDRRVAVLAVVVIAISLLISSVGRIEAAGTTFLAGSGGVPGGREAGAWIEQNVPKGAQMLAVGPSMANILQFYGHRKTFGLSVSPNPLNRNPAYEPIVNPDQAIRSNELQYLVWDAFSASRSKFFSAALQRYADRYHGRVVHTEYVTVTSADGEPVKVPVIKIFEVRP